MPSRTLSTALGLLATATSLSVSAASLYWTEGTGNTQQTSLNTVQRGSTAGGGTVTPVFTRSPGGANGIEAIGGQLYFPDQGAGTITRIDADGGNPVDLVQGINPYDVDVEGGFLYWAEFNSNAIRRINADGTGSASLVFSPSGPVALDVTTTNIFYAEFSNKLLRRAGLDGSNAITLVPGQEIRDLEVVGDWVYFVGYNPTNFQTALQRVMTSGAGLQTILGGLGFANGLDVTADGIYWSELNGPVGRVDLNGANQQTLYTGPFGGTRGVAVLDTAVVPLPGASWLMLTGAGSLGYFFRRQRRKPS